MCTKLINIFWIFLALIVAPTNGCRKADVVDTSDMKIPARIASRPPGATDKVSFEIEESDDLASFRQITKGMRVEKVKQILKDFQCVSVGSGFVIDAYILGDQSVVKIWYDKGCVIRVRHNDDKPMIDWGSSFRSNKDQSKKSEQSKGDGKKKGKKKGDAADAAH